MKLEVDAMTGGLPRTTATPHLGGVGERLREVLAEVLQVQSVDPDAHFFDKLGADSMLMARFCARLRKRDDVPSVSMRDVYANPTIRRLADAFATPAASEETPAAAPAKVQSAPLQMSLAEVLAEVLNIEHVDPQADFFQKLGADSMIMARFCARLRKRADLPSISMKEVYANPTISSLAAAVAPPPAATHENIAPVNKAKTSVRVDMAQPIETWRYVLCGVLQYATGIAFLVIGLLIAVRAYTWMLAGSSYLDIYLRSLAASMTLLLAAIVLPIFAKLLLIGTWTPRKIRIWSLDYYRFWLVKTLVQSNPLVLFPAPIYIMYLRLLGAKVGRNVLIVGHRVPICTDLLTIGDNAVIRKDSYLNGYRANAGWIEIGSITIGANAVVGEMTVLDIHTELGDGAQIGHSSSLHAGHSIPAGEHWCGSPARQKTEVDYAGVPPRSVSTLRKTAYVLTTLVPAFLLGPAFIAIGLKVIIWLSGRPYFTEPTAPALTFHEFYRDALILCTALFIVGIPLGLAAVTTIPRLLNLAIKPDRVYPLYGFHYWVQGMIGRLTNVRFFTRLFGDSSFIVYYLRAIGYDLNKVIQTGSNFGTEMKHDNPFLVSVGSGTMVADALSLINADYSSTSFRMSRVRIGADNFLGNQVAYSAQGKTGDNCLLGTKVMVPLDGEVREGIGLLGSPSFEIPRSVLRDSQLADELNEDELKHRLRRKNRHNLATMGIFLLVEWGNAAVLFLLAFTMVDFFPNFGTLSLAVAMTIVPFFSLFYHAFMERAAQGFRPLRPRTCSIYEPYFWSHERYWKLMTERQLMVFDGTPLKGLAWRLLGVKVGRRLFDDGAMIIERTMVTLGDDVTLNQTAVIQPHSQEDGGFKSDYVTIGSGCTIGVSALVHYGVVMGDGAQIGPNSFLMKGEEVPAYTRWAENPARETAQIEAFRVKRPAPLLAPPRAINAAALVNGAQAR
jgi:non-ribosomal peptide synthetase-like protein